ncbi:cysteine-rich repeat secretory protein 55-like [Neltuma alba]|uniref:cysteine-rich repeat secretory protein 55-like n=1 Tax=Neltuma alba TaxID=207710 RepID=UPI0010A571EF|nr:cysteine-rich repeat secretory protein 55-like [Prosopis alba]
MSLFFKIFFLLLICSCNAESQEPLGNFCNENTNITAGSKLSANIDQLLAELVPETPSSGFVSASFGKEQDQIHGLSQCRQDVSKEDCSICIQDAAKEIRKKCPDQADSRIWYDYCFLRYSNQSFVGKVDTSFGIIYWNLENVSDPEAFNKELRSLMDEIKAEAVMAKNKGLGKGKTELSSFVTLYALVQCTGDLSDLSCAQCLAIAENNFGTFCSNSKGCRVLYSSCYVRYELYPFFFPLDTNITELNNTEMAIVYP